MFSLSFLLLYQSIISMWSIPGWEGLVPLNTMLIQLSSGLNEERHSDFSIERTYSMLRRQGGSSWMCFVIPLNAQFN